LAYALNNIGYVADEQGDMQKALEYYNKSLNIQEAIHDNLGLAQSLINIGSIYESFGDITKTLEYYHKSLKVREDIHDESGVAVCLNNIGLVYFKQKFYPKASTSYFKALKILEKINDVAIKAIVLSNIGLVYKEQQNYESALNYFQRARLLQENIHDEFNLFATLNNIGTVYEKQQNYTLALESFNKNLKLSETLNYKKGIAVSLYNISDVSFKTGNLTEAQTKGQLSLQLFQELGFPDYISNVSHLLSEIYDKKGNYKDAYMMQVLYKKMTDSTNNDVNRKVLIQRDLQYTFEKKVIADSLKVDEARKVFFVKIKHEKNQRYYLYGGVALLLVFSGFMFNRFKVTQKQNLIINNQKLEVELKNEEISQQKELVDVKQKEIIDSINYAKRIQQAVLTGDDVWDKISKEHFILFKPKDIVSGDFYWAYNTPNGRSIFALADCTGHGVPGGFMSMLGNSFLNEIVVENKIFKANEILNRLRSKVIAALEQKGQTEQKDGMDISLCVWNKMDNTLEFSGANNPLWLLRKTVSSSVSSRAESRDENREIIEYKADKMPIVLIWKLKNHLQALLFNYNKVIFYI
jgi:tetratricopeptide (TPR) repeat protein